MRDKAEIILSASDGNGSRGINIWYHFIALDVSKNVEFNAPLSTFQMDFRNKINYFIFSKGGCVCGGGVLENFTHRHMKEPSYQHLHPSLVTWLPFWDRGPSFISIVKKLFTWTLCKVKGGTKIVFTKASCQFSQISNCDKWLASEPEDEKTRSGHGYLYQWQCRARGDRRTAINSE